MSNSTTDSWSPDDRSPPKVPDHDLIREIGRGGFGRVWLARNQPTGGLRAVKVIPLHSSGSRDVGAREIKSLVYLERICRLHHPSLTDIHYIGKTIDERSLYYTMDLADDVQGASPSLDPAYEPATLKTRLASGSLTPDECLRCARRLLEGLAFLHTEGMVHRDVKPANCLFVEGALKLADFGLLTEADRHTAWGGTLVYTPPDGRTGAPADVFSAGLVIYETVTGLPAKSFPELGEKAGDVVENPILGALNRVVIRACHSDPKQSFQDAGAMLAELEASTRPRQTRRRLAVRAGGWLLLLALGVGGLWMGYPRRVHVNFITEPYDAAVYLNGDLQRDEGGVEYRTPCTIPSLSQRVYHVEFRRNGSEDFDAGEVDFARTRELDVRMSPGR